MPDEAQQVPPVSGARRAWVGLALVMSMLGATSLWRWTRVRPDAEDVAFEPHVQPRPMANLRFRDRSGRATDLSALRGRVVLLNIWATWCPPCREEMPTLDALQARLGGPGFEVVALSMDERGSQVAQAFLDRIGILHLRAAVDEFGEAAARYSALGVPMVLILDPDGRENLHCVTHSAIVAGLVTLLS